MRVHVIVFYIILFAFFIGCSGEKTKRPVDWKSEWAIKDSFSLSIDTQGYNFPTSIAFVPNPGKEPKDPLYFVTELRGKVKVVTNDRSVYTFAQDFFQLIPEEELPLRRGEIGMAGICLDPKNGYVFVTFAYQNSEGSLYNNILRFTTKPGTFSVSPSSQLAFTDIFSQEESGISHQIGNCQVRDDQLYVGVGDANRPVQSRQLDSLLGKILRMTVDGKPVTDNPFYQNNDPKITANYIYAYGFRNPFGLYVAEERLFVGDNGREIDRFLEVEKGENYFWDGSDFSIGSRAALILSPSVALVQMQYFPESVSLFPLNYRGQFYVAASGFPAATRPTRNKGIVALNYDFDKRIMRNVPEYFVEYRGNGPQSVVGVALGPDGLYFLPLFADVEKRSPVLKVSYNPSAKHPFKIGQHQSAESLIHENGCLYCHSMERGIEKEGPSLHRQSMVKRITDRIQSKEYKQKIQQLDNIIEKPYSNYADARRYVSQTKGIEQIRLWMQYHLMEPRFDNPKAQMPNFGFSKAQAESITNFLIDRKDQTFPDRVRAFLRRPSQRFTYRDLFYMFIAGILFTLVLVYTGQVVRSRWLR